MTTAETLQGRAIELLRRGASGRTLDELYFLLVNDLRTLVPFDRGELVFHMGGESRLVAVSGRSAPDTKSELFDRIETPARFLRDLDKALLLTATAQPEDFPDLGLSEEQKQSVIDYIEWSGCVYFLCAPLMYAGRPAAHLFLEFFGETPPEDDAVILLLGLAPTLAVILVSRRLIEQEPAVARLLETTAGDKKWGVKKTRGMIALGTAALLFLIVICIPLEKSASGEAVVVPWERGVAFSNIESLVEKVFVDEGGSVNAGDPIAQLDPTDLQYKMESAERQAEILAKKIALLQREADTNPEKLADRKIVELERQKALKDFQYFKKQFEYLTIRAPQDGVVVTRDLKSLVGKKFRTGEPVCEIAEPSHYAVEISVPEEKVGPTNAGMTGFLYLNNNPMDGIGIVVETVAPEAEATPRLGNVFRVTCKLKSPREGLKIGMKGTAKIVTGSESIASGAIHGAVGLRRRLSLYF